MSKLVRDFSRRRITLSGPGILCSRCQNSFKSFQDVESHFRDLDSFVFRDVETCSRFFKTSNHLFGIRNNLFEMLKLVQQF